MNLTRLIRRKRDGGALSSEEIHRLVADYSAGHVPDYQMSALAMAICLCGMSDEETAALTDAKVNSGTVMQWPDDGRPVVDKHSTGGIGDKVSLVLAPLLACAGLRVPMISGRGLGPTGGTLDKLEAIPGFRTNLSLAEIQEITERVGCVITGATDDIAPADRKLYALRDVTGTVESIPLITASIMSKKLAEGIHALVLDVKFGSGAFMKNIDDARALVHSLVKTGQRMGVATAAKLTDMNQPLGRMVGHAVEVNESIETLRGEGPEDLTELTLALGAELLRQADVGHDIAANESALQQHIASGAALDKFREMVAAQGGDLDAPRRVAPAYEHCAARDGFVHSINAQSLGEAVIEMGGGRKVIVDRIDHSVGLHMLVRIGDRVDQDQPLLRVFGHAEHVHIAPRMIAPAVVIGDDPAPPPPLIVPH